MSALIKPHKLHVVDVLGNVSGRDQPVMRIDKALELVSLLGEENFTDNNTVFFDPFCKAGEILFACAYMSCSVKSKRKLMSNEEIHREIFASNRYFALAPDERHHRLSLRTFLGNENSHSERYNHIIRNGNYLSEIDGRLDKHKFNEELEKMIEYIKKTAEDKKIVAVGNPPYQESDGGHGKSARAIYNFFIESLIDFGKIDKFVLVVPARWFSGGKGLDKFRKKMIKSKKIKAIRYFENPHEIFPTVEIRGGVCFLHQDKQHNGNVTIDNGTQAVEVDMSEHDILVPHTQAYPIVEKVMRNSRKFLNQIVWSRKPFGLEGNYFKVSKNYQRGDIECFCEKKEIKKISRGLVTKNADKITSYKVAFPRASGGGKGNRDKILPRAEYFFILGINQISTETYSIAGDFTIREEAENFLLFLQTYLARFLLGLRKPSQDTSKKTFAWIPLMDTKIKWTDEKLFDHFGINEQEQQYIKQKVNDWTA